MSNICSLNSSRIFNVITTINTIPDRDNNDDIAMSLILRTISEYTSREVTRIDSYAFMNCDKLAFVDLSAVGSIYDYAFGNSGLKYLILRRVDAIPMLMATTAFSAAPMNTSSAYGRIYVPRALIDQYKTATNWSAYADRFRVLEEYTVDGTTTGEFDKTKM